MMKVANDFELGSEVLVDNINAYIRWAYSVIQYSPQPTIYQNFIFCLRLANKDDAALSYAREAARLYPTRDVFKKLVEELEART